MTKTVDDLEALANQKEPRILQPLPALPAPGNVVPIAASKERA